MLKSSGQKKPGNYRIEHYLSPVNKEHKSFKQTDPKKNTEILWVKYRLIVFNYTELDTFLGKSFGILSSYNDG